jgi:mono/diheme cytochrome c family protein
MRAATLLFLSMTFLATAGEVQSPLLAQAPATRKPAPAAAATGTKAATGTTSATGTTYKDVYAGWKWWHVYCFRCHGVNAVATTMAPNLLDPNLKLTPAQFLKIVRDGREAKGMQSWAKLLDAKQIGQIHLYVRARADKVLPPGRPDELGPNKTAWVPPTGWPKR